MRVALYKEPPLRRQLMVAIKNAWQQTVATGPPRAGFASGVRGLRSSPSRRALSPRVAALAAAGKRHQSPAAAAAGGGGTSLLRLSSRGMSPRTAAAGRVMLGGASVRPPATGEVRPGGLQLGLGKALEVASLPICAAPSLLFRLNNTINLRVRQNAQPWYHCVDDRLNHGTIEPDRRAVGLQGQGASPRRR